MEKRYVVSRDVTPDECDWLTETVKSGTIVHEYLGYTYGCVGDGAAVTFDRGQTPFFELPLDSLRHEPR